MLKTHEIERSISDIRKEAHDDELAHEKEDALYTSFIQYIAAGGTVDLRAKAERILSTKSIEFSRWFA